MSKSKNQTFVRAGDLKAGDVLPFLGTIEAVVNHGDTVSVTICYEEVTKLVGVAQVDQWIEIMGDAVDKGAC